MLTCERSQKYTSLRRIYSALSHMSRSFLFARKAGAHMLAQQIRGSIILIGSMSATICVRPRKQATYNASEGAIVMLAKSLATEWEPRGTRVHSLSPGYMHTDLIKGLLEKEGKEKANAWVKDIPLGRMANPKELRGTIVWLASEAGSYLNESDVVSAIKEEFGVANADEQIVDGGYTAWKISKVYVISASIPDIGQHHHPAGAVEVLSCSAVLACLVAITRSSKST
jgi:NAD(P)-dependent dehydrogenase (short-subunit alcohol dehydrogenase family)